MAKSKSPPYRQLISDVMPWMTNSNTDLGLARKYHVSISEVKRLRMYVRSLVRWQMSQGPWPGHFDPPRRKK